MGHHHPLQSEQREIHAVIFARPLLTSTQVAFEASPITTRLEIEVGQQLCEMLGYDISPKPTDSLTPTPWGHIASDGTLANMESMWYVVHVLDFRRSNNAFPLCL